MHDNTTAPKRPCVLIIRDGWGENPNPKMHQYDATRLSKTPVADMLENQWPKTLIATSGKDVGLPNGTMGNSEVGHQNIGAGRIVNQENMRLTQLIRSGEFFENKTLLASIAHCKKNNTKLHLMGLISDGGVHSLLGHLYGLLDLAKRNNFTKVFVHGFTDGRDTLPKSAAGYAQQVEDKMNEIGVGKFASIVGRFWSMDRDNRWERVCKAYRLLREGTGDAYCSAVDAINANYGNDITDEFVEPAVMVDNNNNPIAKISDGDCVIFFNFRGDRPREITRAFVDPDFIGFERTLPDIRFVCLTQYDTSIPAPVAFVKPPKMKDIGGSYIASLGLKQFRAAETEKYPHVTFFFNDYTEPPFAGEEREIIPSPKVTTYDLQPEMSAPELKKMFIEKVKSKKYDFMVLNFANPDMVGHTGVMDAVITACETTDTFVGEILDAIKSVDGTAIVTADHGNLELMYNVEAQCPMTSHTIYTVPLYVVDKRYQRCKLREGGRLADVMPTVLHMMSLPIPEAMTGESLIIE